MPVRVRIGSSEWTTSVFPSRADATYVLPIKRPIRTSEGLEDGSTASISLTVDPDRI